MPYYFNNTSQRWTNDSNGRFVSEAQVISELRTHQQAAESELQALTNRLYDGNITVAQWQVSVAQTLKDAHLAQSAFAVGGKRNMTQANYGRVGGVLRDEYGYLNQFAQDIVDGKQSRAQAVARIAQYGQATQQSYWREYANDTNDKIYWRLNPSDHCKDCVELAGNSPYTATTLPTFPGAGETVCRGNCKCELHREAA